MSLLTRRRPLLRAAAVGGAASRAAPPVASPATAAGGVTRDVTDTLTQLGQLYEQGVLTDDEFARQKALLLAG